MDYYDDIGTKPLKEKAENGDVAACLELSYRYNLGTDMLKQDDEKALFWFQKSDMEDYKVITPYFKDKNKVAWLLLKYNKIDKAVSFGTSLEDSVDKVRFWFDIYNVTHEDKYYNEAVSLCELITKNINLYIEDDWNIAQFYKYIYEQTQDEKYRDEAIMYFKSILDNRLYSKDKVKPTENEQSYVFGKKVFLDPIFSELIDLSHNSKEKRRYLIASLDIKSIESKELFNKVNEYVINNFDLAYDCLNETEEMFGKESHEYKKEKHDWTNMLFSEIDYNERKIIYFAKDINDLAGCYDKNIYWLFTIDKYPKEIKFAEGHPLPNTIYMAVPSRKARYVPLEIFEEELFKTKIRDFQTFCRCLGATKILYRSVKGKYNEKDYDCLYSGELGGEYMGHEATVNANIKKKGQNTERFNGKEWRVDTLNPKKRPYVPENLKYWLSVDEDWDSLKEARLENDQISFHRIISSKRSNYLSTMQINEINIAYESFIAKAHLNYQQEKKFSFSHEEEMEWEFEVTFKPLEELNNIVNTNSNYEQKKVQNDCSQQIRNTQAKVNEQKYVDNLIVFFEDSAAITPRERKMLDHIRQSLCISEERAKELEESLKPKLTEDEQEYLDMYKEYAEKGEITEKERRRLDKFAMALGISEDRITVIEKLAI